MATVAMLGLGAMGSRMAASLLRAGHDVAVWNRSVGRAGDLLAAGAREAATPAAAAAGAAFVFAMVRDDAASEAVWLGGDGALAAMPAGTVAAECSTVTVAHAKTLAAAAAARDVAFLDSPVAGSRPQAEAGQLIWLVGGADAAVARTTPLFLAMGGAVHHAGANGAGAAVKLAVNAMLAVQISGLAEMLGFLRHAGVDAARAAAIFGSTPVCSPAAKANLAGMLAHAYAPLFPVDLVRKDLGYAAAVGAETPVADAAAAVFARAATAGDGAANMTAVAKLYDQRS